MAESKDLDPIGSRADAPIAHAVPGAIAEPGQLRALRESAGMTLEQAAVTLRLASRQVAALENGAWDELPGTAFVRGALRSYARLLGADLAPLLERVGPTDSIGQVRPEASLGITLRRDSMIGFGGGGAGNRWVWIVLAVLGVVAVATFFAGGQGLSGASSWLASSAPPAAQSEKTDSIVRETLPLSAAVEANSPAAAPSVAAPSAPATLGMAPPPPASPRTSAAAPALRFVFDVDSWVDIRDATGAQLLLGVQPAGSERTFDGKAPFAMVIGNASRVRLERAGKPVVLEPAPASGTARLTVD